MSRKFNVALLVIGAIICFLIAAGIYFGMVPSVSSSPSATDRGAMSAGEAASLLFFAFCWVVGGIIALSLLAREIHVRTGHPEGQAKPWLAYRPWANPVIYSDILKQILIVWVLLLASVTVVAGFLMLARKLVVAGDYGPLMILSPFAFAAIGMSFPAINLVRQRLRYGRISLTMDPYPGSIGGHVGGHFDIGKAIPLDACYHVSLVCMRNSLQRRTGADGTRHQNKELVWHADGLAEAAPAATGARLNFRFDVPAGLNASQQESSDYHEWMILLTADLPGPDLNRRFLIPVFPTGKASQQIRVDSTDRTGFGRENLADVHAMLKISLDSDGAVRLNYPIFKRSKLTAGFVLLAVGLGCLLPGLAILMDELHVTGIAFTVIGALFLAGGLYVLLHNISARISPAGIGAKLKLLGIPVRIQKVAAEDVDFLGTYMSNWIAAWPKQGKAITLSPKFDSEEEAKIAVQLVCDWTGYAIETKRKHRERNKRQSRL